MDLEGMFLDARSLFTVLSFLTFIGIVLWAYSSRRGADFEAAANLPFADEKDIQVSEK
ncbi:cbb3-type cytochrome c oxidase subunit 3 [Noviherbaspirillum sp.]|uniref:cbb3-type cytochrome oxidase subunit 3 n=1 Tax=Noviherbaspirillum sp. TaxID=1926288 RepID=UPI002B4A6BD8|nr:cbb3-type cytochrome c oxidase subunit 3 [Noviherbaspirillum sp.]HJV82812.1 cbb3-type cytochrome c oxidase subunit 3 [Noviherbaspirillum sp.]